MKWPPRNGGATYLRHVTDIVQAVQYSDNRRRCSWLHAGLYCIAPRPFTQSVFYFFNVLFLWLQGVASTVGSVFSTRTGGVSRLGQGASTAWGWKLRWGCQGSSSGPHTPGGSVGWKGQGALARLTCKLKPTLWSTTRIVLIIRYSTSIPYTHSTVG